MRKQLVAAHSLHHIHHPGTPTYVTKNLFFPNFNVNLNPYYSIQDIKLLGNAKVSEDAIQIPDVSATVDPTYQAGRAIYASPIRLFDPLTKTPASFQTTFSFKFTSTTTTTANASVSDDLHSGDGLAFIIVPDEYSIGKPGPWLGILNDACGHYKVFAVEFDTCHDPGFGDPDDDHVGINLGSIVSFKTASSSKANVSLHNNTTHRAWIAYDGQRRRIEVHLGLDGDRKPSEPILSSPINLSPFLKEYMFVGFSASTGNLTQINSILSWNFSSTNLALVQKPSAKICHKNVAHQVSKYTRIGYTAPSSFLIFVAVIALCTVALICFYFSSARSDHASTVNFILLVDKKQKPTPPNKPRRYTIVEIFKATRRFSKLEILGSDVRGVLYRGTLPNGCHVAVKRFSNQFLNLSRLYSSRILKRINELSQISHSSFAPIRGWCCDNRETIIVYDYFGNGSLDQWLYGPGVLPWSRRVKLIKEIAEALCFLHSKGLTHGNLKTSSVFLDHNYHAVLGDYGFLFFLGTAELAVSGKNGDVFGFGMLVLEAIAGKKMSKLNGGEGDQTSLLRFAWSTHERGEKAKMVEERVGTCDNSEQAGRLLEIGLSCSLSEKNGRPCMEEVVQYLNTQKPIPKLPLRRPPELFSKQSTAGLGLSP
ncbi:L-type lectin-domain containing receptor kinase VIII.2-like [Corylus avellana]|uniref:L-type lectin-domain containing receptor kinase VIII.2-like n=1 Tax=Corylus avellana TaxID=13451 RepID=UPI001E229735|nr:L-type lectin-domain containing receptor kinase VIII.2-like [Corylus avellana]